MPQKSWHEKPHYIIAALVLFPPLGIPLVWLSSWSRPIKIAATVVMGGLFVGAIAPRFLPKDPPPVVAVPSPTPQATPIAPPSPDPLQPAINQAEAAGKLSASAKTLPEWRKVAIAWESSMKLMKQVPPSHPRYELARQKVREYDGYLSDANQRMDIILKPRTERGEQVYKAARGKTEIWGMFAKYPAVTLMIEESEWAKLSDADQVNLTLYVKSLVRDVQQHPAKYIDIPVDAPLYPKARENLSYLCPTCWSVMLLKRTSLGQTLVDRTVVQGLDPWEQTRKEVPGTEGEEGETFRRNRGLE